MINGFDIIICGAKKNKSDSFQAESVLERKKRPIINWYYFSSCKPNAWDRDRAMAVAMIATIGCENRWNETSSMIFVKFEVLSKSEWIWSDAIEVFCKVIMRSSALVQFSHLSKLPKRRATVSQSYMIVFFGNEKKKKTRINYPEQVLLRMRRRSML